MKSISDSDIGRLKLASEIVEDIYNKLDEDSGNQNLFTYIRAANECLTDSLWEIKNEE